MAEPKVQLVAPLGNLTVPGMNVTGVVTATLGDVGVAGSIIQGNNIDIGTGIITATSFVGDQIGTYRAASLTGSPDLVVGVVTSSGFVAQITGDVTGNLTGNVVGTAGSILSGNNVRAGIATVAGMSGDGSNLTGIAATSYNTQTVPGSTYSINVTNDGSSAYTLSGTDRNGSVSGNNASVSVEIGDTLNFVVDASGHPFYIRVSDGGANVSTPAATNQGAQSGTVSWTPNTAGTYYYQCGNHAGMIGTITVTATTTIDLSAGNMITFNQSANTTVSFANTETAMDVTLIRIKDVGSTARTITWPDSVKWDGGSAPTLISKTVSGDSQQFQFLTRDSGLTWYAWENYESSVVLVGTLWMWGNSEQGKLGQNSRTNYSSPVQVPGTWKSIGGNQNISAINKDGELYTWGWNASVASGLLGLNDTVTRSSPTQIPGTWSRVNNIGLNGTNYYTSGAIKSDGTLWIWGTNSSGQLGLNDIIQRSSPCQLAAPSGNWDKVTLAQTAFGGIKDGKLYMCGRATSGGLGNNDRTNQSSPIQVGTDTTWANVDVGDYGTDSFATKTNGTLWSWGYGSVNGSGSLGQNNNGVPYSSPTQIGTGTDWATSDGKLAAGDKNTGCIKTDGTLWVWGSNQYGMLGQNSYTKRSSPTQIPGTTWDTLNIGGYSMWASKTDGTQWAWGQGDSGQFAQNDVVDRSSPIQVPGFQVTFTNNGSITAFSGGAAGLKAI
jgi:alpha-tubulin suppressor-like RCC1 family protein/plastocyanin